MAGKVNMDDPAITLALLTLNGLTNKQAGELVEYLKSL